MYMYLATGHPMLYHTMHTTSSQRAGEGSQIFQIHVNDVIFTSFAPCGSVRNIRHAANHGNPAMHGLGPQDHEHSPVKSDLLPRNAAASKRHQNHCTRAPTLLWNILFNICPLSFLTFSLFKIEQSQSVLEVQSEFEPRSSGLKINTLTKCLSTFLFLPTIFSARRITSHVPTSNIMLTK